MELQVLSLTNIKMQLTKTLSVLVLIFLNACISKKNEKAIAVANKIQFSFYNADSVEVLTKQGITYINKQIANGYLFLLNTENDTLKKEGFINGKRHGICYKKYLNLHYQYLHNYINGKMEGIQRTWWENGKLKQEATYKNDLFHGKLQEWSFTGTLTRDNNYVNGQEEGKQRLWYDNGKLRANYVVKNGRIYGLSGTMNCFNAVENKK